MKTGYVGTYSEHGSQGIYQFTLEKDSGKLGNVSLFTPLINSKYLASTQDYLFSLFDDEKESGVAVFDISGTLVAKETYESSTACYLLVSGEDIYTSHYHLGTVSHLTFDARNKTLTFVKQVEIAEKAGSHQVISHGDLLYVPCLHLDRIKIFKRDLTLVDEISMPSGCGCRHGVISKDGDYLYVIGELSNEIYLVNLQSNKVEGSISILPEGVCQDHGGAALRISEDGKTLYASTREPENRITVLDVAPSTLSIKSTFVVDGKHPRDILNVEQDRYLLVATRGTDELHSYDINKEFCEINRVEIPAGISIVMKGC